MTEVKQRTATEAVFAVPSCLNDLPQWRKLYERHSHHFFVLKNGNVLHGMTTERGVVYDYRDRKNHDLRDCMLILTVRTAETLDPQRPVNALIFAKRRELVLSFVARPLDKMYATLPEPLRAPLACLFCEPKVSIDMCFAKSGADESYQRCQVTAEPEASLLKVNVTLKHGTHRASVFYEPDVVSASPHMQGSLQIDELGRTLSGMKNARLLWVTIDGTPVYAHALSIATVKPPRVLDAKTTTPKDLGIATTATVLEALDAVRKTAGAPLEYDPEDASFDTEISMPKLPAEAFQVHITVPNGLTIPLQVAYAKSSFKVAITLASPMGWRSSTDPCLEAWILADSKKNQRWLYVSSLWTEGNLSSLYALAAGQSGGTGTAIMSALVYLATTLLGVRNAHAVDAAHVYTHDGQRVYLSLPSALRTGESWYSKFGFKWTPDVQKAAKELRQGLAGLDAKWAAQYLLAHEKAVMEWKWSPMMDMCSAITSGKFPHALAYLSHGKRTLTDFAGVIAEMKHVDTKSFVGIDVHRYCQWVIVRQDIGFGPMWDSGEMLRD